MADWFFGKLVKAIIDYIINAFSSEAAKAKRIADQKARDEQLRKAVDTAKDEADEVKKAQDAANG